MARTAVAPPNQGPVSSSAQASTLELASRLRRALVLLRRQAWRHSPSGLTLTQVSALATVVRSGPLSVGQLAEAEALPSPAVTRLADKLEEAGFIGRRPNPHDRRGVLLEATEAGERLMAEREQASHTWLAERLGILSARDQLVLHHAVEILERLADDRRLADERRLGKEVPL